MHHVAILHANYIEAILNGSKVVESRLSATKSAPFGRVAPGDTIHFKASGGPFSAIAHVSGIMTFEDLRPSDIRTLSRRYGRQVAAPAEYWEDRLESRYATFIWLSEVRASEVVPTNFAPTPGARAAWYVLETAKAARRSA